MTRLLTLLLAAAGCGRTSLPADRCILSHSPDEIDFGLVVAGATRVGVVTVSNSGAEVCVVSDARVDGDPGFTLPDAPVRLSVLPFQSGAVEVGFHVDEASLPLSRKGSLHLTVDHAPEIEVPLAARLQSDCRLTIEPAAVDFGLVPLGETAARTVRVTNTGRGECAIAGVALGSGSDPGFSVAAGQATSLLLQPQQSAVINLGFGASDAAPPHHRTGTLVFSSTDPDHEEAVVPLSADIDVGCNLTIMPVSLDFGRVILNTVATAAVTLGNDGTRPCQVSAVALGAGTDPGFSLSAGQITAFTVAVGATQSIPVTFSAFDSAPPHQKTGTLVFQTGNSRAPNAIVPLSAYVDTVCVEASQWIYTVDDTGLLSRFDPATLTFTDIGFINCPGSGSPFSMAVDQNAVAWVGYSDGRLYQVDTSTAACSATTFQPNQQGIQVFGMGFVFDPTTGLDTLYIAGGAFVGGTSSTLATVSFPALQVTSIGTTEGDPELSGTGDGTLWGFFPGNTSTTGLATLTQIDRATGDTLERHEYPALTGGSNWAMKFWGGSFWIFLDQSVYRADRTSPDTIVTAIAQTGRRIVGAGVSTCAPLH